MGFSLFLLILSDRNDIDSYIMNIIRSNIDWGKMRDE